MTPVSSQSKSHIKKAGKPTQIHIKTDKKSAKNIWIVGKGAKVVQYPVSSNRLERKTFWNRWVEECKIEIGSKIIDQAIREALKFRELQKKAQVRVLIDPELLFENGGDS